MSINNQYFGDEGPEQSLVLYFTNVAILKDTMLDYVAEMANNVLLTNFYTASYVVCCVQQWQENC